MRDNMATELVDTTSICSTFPERPDPEVSRENMITTLGGLLKSATEVIVVEGEEGIGKTTLLSQFARTHNHETFGAFVTDSSRYAWDSTMLARNLCEQIQFTLGNLEFRKHGEGDIQSIFRASVLDLQKKANWEKTKYFFVIDGLEEIPEEENEAIAEIIDLLPFGLTPFRFLFSGSTERLMKFRRGKVVFKPWALPTFSLDETIKFFEGIVLNREQHETIYKISHKGMPGRLAAIRRLCLASPVDIDDLLGNLSDHAPDLLEKEWSVVEKAPEPMRLALAALCFDSRRHNIDSLATLCGIDSSQLKEFIAKCTFVQTVGSEGEQLSFTSYFRRFAATKLLSLRKIVFQKGVELMMAKPESNEALNHLPYYLHESGDYSALLEYLSGDHIGKLMECTESWIPLDEKVDLGIATSNHLNRGADLMRFGLQRAAVRSLESCEQKRSEIEAYIALGDFNSAFNTAQTAMAREDRLHMLAIIASAKRKRNPSLSTEFFKRFVIERIGIRHF